MKLLTTVALLVTIGPAAACTVSVDENRAEQKADVRITTPVGQVLVHTGGEPSTGLGVYPGSIPVRRNRHAEAANVWVGNSAFGVKVAAANFESDAAPEEILGFYRGAMRAHGRVVECHGDVDFKRSGPVCRRGWFATTTQLAVGTQDRHRLVSVKPRGNGSEYAVVFVQTRS